MKVKKNNGYDYDGADDERLIKYLKRKGFDIKAFEFLSRRHDIKRSFEEQKLANSQVEESYSDFTKSVLLGIEPSCSSQNEGGDDSDEEDDMDTDPQYAMFFKDLIGDGTSYKLEYVMGNQTLSRMYGEKDDLDDKHEMQKNVEDEDYQNIENKKGRVREYVNNETRSAKTNEYVENTRTDSKENSKTKKRKVEVRDLKTRSAKTNEYKDKRSSENWRSVLERELNSDDVEGSYRFLLDAGKIVGDRVEYADEGQKLVNRRAHDVECSSDSEVVEIPNNEVQNLRSRERGVDSVFRKQLMAKLGEPYDYEEYKELWKEIKLERPKIKHYDLRGARSVQPFHTEELSPSYLSTYAPLKAEIDAVGQDRRRRLNYLRGFFFWLKNVAHEDAFEPWLDKECLAVMRKSC